MPHSILIVENEPILARNLRTFFERAGHTVHCAESAAQGERQIGASYPDLVILSHSMPQMDGIGCLRRIKQSHPELPVVLISTEATVELAVTAIKSGAAEFLTKPVSLAKLRQVAETAFCSWQRPGRPSVATEMRMPTRVPSAAAEISALPVGAWAPPA